MNIKRTDFNTKLWNSTKDENGPERKQARDQKRKLTYCSNIYVVSDPLNKETEGKVFIYEYGKKIFDKIMDCISPPFDDMGRARDNADYDPTNAFDPFDLWKGANFRLKMRMVAGYRNYDLSHFDAPGPLKADDMELEKIWKQEYSLKEILEPKNFKTYEELQTNLHRVLGIGNDESNRVVLKTASVKEKPKPLTVANIPAMDDDDDEDLKAFKALAN